MDPPTEIMVLAGYKLALARNEEMSLTLVGPGKPLATGLFMLSSESCAKCAVMAAGSYRRRRLVTAVVGYWLDRKRRATP